MKNGDVNPVAGKCPPDSSTDSDDDENAKNQDTDGWGCTARLVKEKDISW